MGWRVAHIFRWLALCRRIKAAKLFFGGFGERSAPVCPATKRGGSRQTRKALLFIGRKFRRKARQSLRQKSWEGLAAALILVFGFVLVH